MKKHRCPQCGTKFNYEQYGWICPACHAVVLGSAEKQVLHREQTIDRPQQSTVRKSGETRKKLILAYWCMAVMFVIIFTPLICCQIGKLARRQKEAEQPISYPTTEVEMGETISIAPFSLQITKAYLPQWESVAPPTNGQYLAVQFRTAGKNSEDMFQKPDDLAWACLYDVQADAYLTPLYSTQLTGSETIQQQLYDIGVTTWLDQKEGILVFLVTEPVTEYQLCIFAGDNDAGYVSYDVQVNQQYRVSLIVTE